MTNAGAQLQPWERAGCTPQAWLRLLDRVTADWIAAAQALRALYSSAEDPALEVGEPAKTLRAFERATDLHADWRSAIDGEAPTIRSLLQRYRIDPAA